MDTDTDTDADLIQCENCLDDFEYGKGTTRPEHKDRILCHECGELIDYYDF